MRIVIDLDGTICEIRKSHETYADVKMINGADQFIKKLRDEGHYVIIQSARHMATCDSNVGKVMKRIGKVTLDWLEQHSIEYDEIYFGKPNADVYIDDRACLFKSWDELSIEYLQKIAKEK